MAHTDRTPGENVFEDMKQAAITTWLQRDYHEDYIREKLDKIHATNNYADNWYSFLGAMDKINQMIFWHCLKLKGSAEFLKLQRQHYSYFVPRNKE